LIAGAALSLLSYGVITVAQHPTPAQGNSPAVAPAASVALAASAAAEQPAMSPKKSLAPVTDMRASPRECEAARGITSDCIFE
jgi:hypothetical protein